jgi:hypothetical protein
VVIDLKNISPASGTTVHLLGSDVELKWQRDGAGMRIAVPETVRYQAANNYAVSLRISVMQPGRKQ